MKEEINKMIDNLQFISEQESASITITQDGCKEILDYITNLEQENKRLKFYLSVKSNEYDSLEKATKLIGEYKDNLESGYEDYKSRIDKAIERLKKIQENAIKYEVYHDASICQDLINTLTGGNEE